MNVQHRAAAAEAAVVRWEAAQMAVLRFCRDGPCQPEALLGELSISDQELDDVLTYLAENELLVIGRSYAGPVAFAFATHHGRLALQFGSVDGYLRRKNGMANITNDHSTHVTASNVAGNLTVVGGQHNTVSAGGDLPAEVRQEIINGLDELLESLPATADTEVLRGELVELHSTAQQPRTDKETLREKLLHAVAVASASKATAGAIAAIGSLLPPLAAP